MKSNTHPTNIRLRPFREEDAPVLARLLNNKKIWNNIRDFVPHPYSEQDARDFIAICRKEDPLYTFVVEYEEQLAGVVGVVPQKDVYRISAEIGYWLGEPFWGKGIMTEAVKRMVDYGFNDLNLIRIFTGVFDFNKGSHRVLEKAGFKLECIFRKALIKNGVVCDEYRYAIINEE
ncbi:GNAT family N-acetyltransferase [Marinilabilia salmonicolor]|jgi:RimJ/RimL family protein N-acetyltransferase|uniref:RimJ/RimL family protein N-acetyltransferase n=1 Tax=Marinilabilia salmonicolor TaxID=989 RepID=A0A368V753_9BACT|nr:GNAT family N-acetyltransferase [Marinilabilia salmonicolor]RCW36633.1 RimJ/RimL family protein N-acetyltransferase [Marinilabilia salmonicolor]